MIDLFFVLAVTTIIESGITPTGFPLLHMDDIDELGLTVVGKKLVKRALAEVKETRSMHCQRYHGI